MCARTESRPCCRAPYRRAAVDAVPDRVITLLGQLRHPLRLPILLELERGELHAAELAARLGASFDQVDYALGELTRSGLVTIARQEPAGPQGHTLRRVYRGTRSDWAGLIACLDRYAVDDTE
jgi:DNA-binding transcriptional ArsR family regulator